MLTGRIQNAPLRVKGNNSIQFLVNGKTKTYFDITKILRIVSLSKKIPKTNKDYFCIVLTHLRKSIVQTNRKVRGCK